VLPRWSTLSFVRRCGRIQRAWRTSEPRKLDNRAIGIGRKLEVELEDHECAHDNFLVSEKLRSSLKLDIVIRRSWQATARIQISESAIISGSGLSFKSPSEAEYSNLERSPTRQLLGIISISSLEARFIPSKLQGGTGHICNRAARRIYGKHALILTHAGKLGLKLVLGPEGLMSCDSCQTAIGSTTWTCRRFQPGEKLSKRVVIREDRLLGYVLVARRT
jgi:hypothetical protein